MTDGAPLSRVCKHVASGTWPAITVVRQTRITSAITIETRLCVQCCDALSDLLAGVEVEVECTTPQETRHHDRNTS